MARKRVVYLTLELDEETWNKIQAFACFYFKCNVAEAIKRLISDVVSVAILLHALKCPGYRLQLICTENTDMEKPFRPLILCTEHEPEKPTHLTVTLSDSSM